jgi:alpha-D-ribose 1-methylphosphonate 5-triphosphate synthase subunit PhnH
MSDLPRTTTPPAYTDAEARTRETFLALMWSLSYPGRIYTLPGETESALTNIAEALIDLETSYFTPDAALETQLKRTGARALSPQTAAYHFYPAGENGVQNSLAHIEAAPLGSARYPDEAATLIIGCTFETGGSLRLTGPGIQGTNTVQVDVPQVLWTLRSRARYPLGWDVFLVDGARLIGIPRTTVVELML